MRWPWKRKQGERLVEAERELRDAQRRFWRAVGETEAIDRRAAELARELPAGELYLRLARALHRGDA